MVGFVGVVFLVPGASADDADKVTPKPVAVVAVGVDECGWSTEGPGPMAPGPGAGPNMAPASCSRDSPWASTLACMGAVDGAGGTLAACCPPAGSFLSIRTVRICVTFRPRSAWN